MDMKQLEHASEFLFDESGTDGTGFCRKVASRTKVADVISSSVNVMSFTAGMGLF